jgi:hypothetical protein
LLEILRTFICSISKNFQPKYQVEFHSILDDIGAVTNKDDDFVMYNDSESGIILFGCEANLKFPSPIFKI